MTDIPMFASRGWWRVRDRDGSGLIRPVLIDGERLRCIGVERNPKGGPISKGEEISLLVIENDSKDQH